MGGGQYIFIDPHPHQNIASVWFLDPHSHIKKFLCVGGVFFSGIKNQSLKSVFSALDPKENWGGGWSIYFL